MQIVPMEIQGAVSSSPELAPPQPALPTDTAATGGQAAAGVPEQQARQTVQPQSALPTVTAAAGVPEQQARQTVQPQSALPTVTTAAGVTGQGVGQTGQQREALPHLGKRTAEAADLQVRWQSVLVQVFIHDLLLGMACSSLNAYSIYCVELD